MAPLTMERYWRYPRIRTTLSAASTGLAVPRLNPSLSKAATPATGFQYSNISVGFESESASRIKLWNHSNSLARADSESRAWLHAWVAVNACKLWGDLARLFGGACPSVESCGNPSGISYAKLDRLLEDGNCASSCSWH